MYFSEKITLKSYGTPTTDASGFPTAAATSTVVWADKHSIKRSEYFSAQAAGVRVDIGFLVHADDYSDQTVVSYGSVDYDIVRAYQVDGGLVDLTCARR